MLLEEFEAQARKIMSCRSPKTTQNIAWEMDGAQEGGPMAPYHLKTIREVFTGSAAFDMPDFPDMKNGYQNSTEAIDYLAALNVKGLYMADDGSLQELGTKEEEDWRNHIRATIRQKFPEADIDFDTATGRVLLNANIYYACVGPAL